ncbi:MAG: MerR family DNA-binding protein [Pseudohongiellaceae bacterium]
MLIKDAAAASGLPAKTIRYYESLGLVQSRRADNGYRQYGTRDVERMQFLARSRTLGFSLEECQSLLDLYDDPGRASAAVNELARQHLNELDDKIRELNAMKHTLIGLVSRCPGNQSPDCAILDSLAHGQTEQ